MDNAKLDTSSRKRFVKSIPNNTGKSLVVAEVGVAHGDFAKHILGCREDLQLYCIDMWEDNYLLTQGKQGYDITKSNLSSFSEERYKLVKGVSPQISENFEDSFFDVIYIDADHLYEPVLADIKAWYPKVKSGGILFGHDYESTWEGVIKAVNEFCEQNGYFVGVIESSGNWLDNDQDGNSKSWFIVKK